MIDNRKKYDLQKIFELAAKSSSSKAPNLIPFYWKALVSWIQKQIDMDRKILLADFAVVGCRKKQQEKCIALRVLDSLLLQTGLNAQQEEYQTSQTLIAVSFQAVCKLVEFPQERDKSRVTAGIAAVIRVIRTLLQQKGGTDIDLGMLGRIVVQDRLIMHIPVSNGKLPPIKANKSVYECGESFVSSISPRSVFANSVKDKENHPTLTRRFFQIDKCQPVSVDTSPLAKSGQFSHLASDPKSLIATKFTKPDCNKTRYPAVIDRFARTLASPLSSQKYNMSICGRIASHYNPEAKGYYFDKEKKCIMLMSVFEGLSRGSDRFIGKTVPATQKQELQYLNKPNSKLKEKVKARQACYERYMHYILNQIPPQTVAPIRELWIRNVLDSIVEWVSQHSDLRMVEVVIDEMLDTINHLYYEAGRKAILDYVLRDENEKKRLSITQILKPIQDWGCRSYQQIQISEQSLRMTKRARLQFSQTLLIFPQARLKIMAECCRLDQLQLLNLSRKGNSPVNLLYFLKKQQQRIAEVRSFLRSDWVNNIVKHTQQGIASIDKKRQGLFLKSVNTLMTRKLRELVNNSLLKYIEFMESYRKPSYRTCQQILAAEENDPLSPSESVFLVIRLRDQNNAVIFSEDLEDKVRVELFNLLTDVVRQAQQFPKIQSFILSDKGYLWQIPPDDSTLVSCQNRLKLILDENFTIISEVKNIYNQYSYLLVRPLELEEWTRIARNISDYRQMFEIYDRMYEEIEQGLPFQVRMNMILVDCNDIKRKLLLTTRECRRCLEQGAYAMIKHIMSVITRKVDTIKENLKERVVDTTKLLQLQAEIQRVRKEQIPSIRQSLSQLRNWMAFLYEQGCGLILQENFQSIFLTSTLVYSLPEKVELQECRISREKEDLEKQVSRNLNFLKTEVQRLQKDLELLIEQCSLRKQYQNYNKNLRIFSERANNCANELRSLNTQEEHLGWSATEIQEVEKIHQALKPNVELWLLAAQVQSSLKEWKSQCLKDLNAQEVQMNLQKMLAVLTGILSQLPKKHTTSLKIANQLKVELFELQDRYLPLIKIFANRGLKDRHWEQLSKQFQICQNKETLNLQKIINYKMADEIDKVAVLQHISRTATEEWAVEKTRNMMVEAWTGSTLHMREYNNFSLANETSLLDTLSRLELSQQETATLRQNPHSQIFNQPLNEWQSWLSYTHNLLVSWQQMQALWMQLHPIMTQQVVSKVLPIEQSQFETVDHNWRSIVKKVVQQPRLLDFTKNRRLADILHENHQKLIQVKEGLTDYLSAKMKKQPEKWTSVEEMMKQVERVFSQ